MELFVKFTLGLLIVTISGRRIALAQNRVDPDPQCHQDYTKCNIVQFYPVCGRNQNNQYQIFKNMCLFKKNQCVEKRTENWEIFPLCPTVPPPPRKYHCPNTCPEDVQPVCARLNNTNRVFKNRCYYDQILCVNLNWEIVSDQECANMDEWTRLSSSTNTKSENETKVAKNQSDTDPLCKQDYTKCDMEQFYPVCGRNQNGQYQLFKNMCLFKKNQCVDKRTENWEIFHSCPNVSPPSRKYHCPTSCTDKYEPVCAQLSDTNEIREFTNKCHYDRILCENLKWEIVANQECQSIKQQSSLSNIDDSICGISNTQQQQNFKSIEDFLNVKKLDPTSSWKILNFGNCLVPKPVKKCSNKCTKIYRPICAVDNEGYQNTFPNSCTLKHAKCTEPSKGWVLYKQGHCNERFRRRTRLPLSCFGVCSFQYAPFCSISSAGQIRTFTNECEHDFEVCNNRESEWKKLHDGPCTEILSTNNI